MAWLRQVIAQRQSGSLERLKRAVRRNVSASVQAGTTLVGDVTTAGLSWSAVAEAPTRAVVFAEILGLKRERGSQTSEDAWSWIAKITPEEQVAACARPGLSPHAPYSTSGWLYHRAATSRLPLMTHLAEMPEELELLQHGTGPSAPSWKNWCMGLDEWEPIGPRPADFIRKGSSATPTG